MRGHAPPAIRVHVEVVYPTTSIPMLRAVPAIERMADEIVARPQH